MHQEPSIIMGAGDIDTSQRLAQLEAEVSAKKTEVSALREQVARQLFLVVSFFHHIGFHRDRHFISGIASTEIMRS